MELPPAKLPERHGGEEDALPVHGLGVPPVGRLHADPELQALIDRHGLTDRLELQGAFCLDRCGAGGSLEFEGRVTSGLAGANLEEIFRTEVLARLEVD